MNREREGERREVKKWKEKEESELQHWDFCKEMIRDKIKNICKMQKITIESLVYFPNAFKKRERASANNMKICVVQNLFKSSISYNTDLYFREVE